MNKITAIALALALATSAVADDTADRAIRFEQLRQSGNIHGMYRHILEHRDHHSHESVMERTFGAGRLGREEVRHWQQENDYEY